MRSIDGKFSTDGTKIFNTVSGEVIPEDEPLFLLRARDIHAYDTLMYYLMLCEDECTLSHSIKLKERILEFIDFRNKHKDRMKQPGITEHIK